MNDGMYNPFTTEPTPAALMGNGPTRVAKRLFLATRPMFFPASVLPVILGTSWGYRTAGELDSLAFALAVAAVMCVHAGANVLNDVFDELGGADRGNDDRIFPYTGGSRFIQNGVMSVGEMRRWSVLLLALGMVFGIGLIGYKGVGVLLFGLAGMALGILYSLPPVQLSYRGFGELAVGIGFGILPVMGAAWLQTGELTLEPLVLSLPIAFWVTAILLINEVPDFRADKSAGRRTLVVQLGVKKNRWLYILLNGLALVAAIAAVVMGILPASSVTIPALVALLAVYAAQGIGAASPRLKRSIEFTFVIHALGGLWISGWILVPM